MAWPEAPTVEVAYALPERQYVVQVAYEEGLTAAEAVVRSGLPGQRPELAGRPLALGVFGRLVRGEMALQPGDRVEIYRPLKSDPRQLRRQQVAAGRGTAGKAMGRK